MSSRAAARLEHFGFSDVLVYKPGKADWLACGLPAEGTLPDRPWIGELARADVPTCRIDDNASEIRERIQASEFKMCVVVNQARTVLGAVTADVLKTDADGSIETSTQSGPLTFRPNLPVSAAAEYLSDHDLERNGATDPTPHSFGRCSHSRCPDGFAGSVSP